VKAGALATVDAAEGVCDPTSVADENNLGSDFGVEM
jgi:hypothetical protein